MRARPGYLLNNPCNGRTAAHPLPALGVASLLTLLTQSYHPVASYSRDSGLSNKLGISLGGSSGGALWRSLADTRHVCSGTWKRDGIHGHDCLFDLLETFVRLHLEFYPTCTLIAQCSASRRSALHFKCPRPT